MGVVLLIITFCYCLFVKGSGNQLPPGLEQLIPLPNKVSVITYVRFRVPLASLLCIIRVVGT